MVCQIYYLFFRYQWIESCLFFIIYFSTTWITSKYKFCLVCILLLKIVTNISLIAISTSKVTVYCQHCGEGVIYGLVLSCGYGCLFNLQKFLEYGCLSTWKETILLRVTVLVFLFLARVRFPRNELIPSVIEEDMGMIQ